MAQIAGPLMIFSSIMQAGGAIQAGNAEKQAYNQRATESERVGRDIAAAGAQQETEMRYRANLVKGTQEEGAASGGVTGGGSVLELLQETNRRDAMNIANLHYNTESQVYGKTAEAAQARYAGKVAQRRGYIQGITALTSGLGSYSTSLKPTPATPVTGF